MVKVAIRAGLIMAALWATSAQAAAPVAPAAVFAALPQITNPQLSPDGKLLAWPDRSGPVGRVVIYDIAAKSYRRTLAIDPATTLRSLEWADDATLLLNLSQMEINGPRHYMYYRTASVAVDSGKTCTLLMSGGAKVWVTGALLVAMRTSEPHTVIMSTLDYSQAAVRGNIGHHVSDRRADSGWVGELYRVDTRTGKGAMIEEGDQFTDQWAVDVAGAPVARSEWRPARKQYVIEAKSSAGWRPILERDNGQQLRLNGVSQDGKSISAAGPDENGRMRLWTVALDGSGARDISPDASADISDIIDDDFSGAIEGVVFGGANSRIGWLDPAAKMRYESVAHAFPGREVTVDSHSQDGSRVVAEVEDLPHPPTYYLIDFKTHRADIVGEAYPGLDNVPLGSVRVFTYPARDGTRIPACLTLPPGLAPKNLPMVVLPHDGPNAHDRTNFYWLSQFLATRGYAVLQPQFRGSSGFGEVFRNAGRGQWGGLMQDDVTDGVKTMIHDGTADPHRICIVGAGYGGYAALAGAAFTPNLYACAVSINGPSDLPALLRDVVHRFGPESDPVAYWEREIGSPSDSNVVNRSPAFFAAEVTAPVLLLYTADDSLVPSAQSGEMAKALAAAGKRVESVKLQGEDPWEATVATRLEVLENTDRFLQQYLK